MAKYILILYMFFLVGCKKDKPLEPGEGKLTAFLNNAYWQPGSVIAHHLAQNKYSIGNSVYNSDNLLRETLILNNLVKSYDRIYFVNIHLNTYYKDSLRVTFYTSVADGDVGCDDYTIIENDTATNYLQILEQKDDFNEIWGIFSATLIRTGSCAGSLYPDTLRFRDGKFHVKLK